MGRRSSKSSPAVGAPLPYDTVGMTILPGRSLPEWAEPHAGAEVLAGPELIADAPMPASEQADAQPPAEVPGAPAGALPEPREWGAAPTATQTTTTQHAPAAPEPAYAMAGAALVGAAAVGSPPGYGSPDPGYPSEPSRYPAAPTAGLTASAPAGMSAPPAAPAHAPGPPAAAPGSGQAWAAQPATAPTAHGSQAPVMSSYGATGPVAPTTSQASAAGGTATAYATASDTRTSPESAGAAGTAQATQTEAPSQDTPSSGWKSPERPELSPEHVALLSWWADMIAAGQFPAPPGSASPTAPAADKPDRRSFPLKAAAVSLVAIAAVGTAAVFGPKMLTSDDPVVVPATEVTLPATVGTLVPITDPAVGAELETLLGFGLRPAGVTVTNAYGAAGVGPLALAAMATTIGAPAEAVGQIAAWAERTGATVAPSVAGTGANEGITCAAVEAIPEAQPGSFCVWSATGKRGQTYAVAMSVEDAQAMTNELRTSVTGP